MTLGAAAADAADFGDMFSFRGYGTLAISHSSEDAADIVGTNFMPDGVGYTRDWDQRGDTRLAGQLSAKFGDRFTMVVQVLSQYRYDRTFSPEIEWANLKYQVTPEFSMRVGRIAMPTFLGSETRLVGYANPSVRPPQELYFLSPITSSDGVDVSYSKTIGKLIHTVQAFYGESSPDLPNGGKVEADGAYGLNWAVQRGDASVRVGYIKTQYDLKVSFTGPLFGGITSFGNALAGAGFATEASAAAALVRKYDLDNTKSSYLSFGGTYDPGQWFVTGEGFHVSEHGFLADTWAAYAIVGYRIGRFTPYATIAKLDPDIPNEPGIPTARLSGGLLTAANGINGGLNTTLNAFNASQQTASVGIRWDFMSNFAFKAQYDHISLGDDSDGLVRNVHPELGFELGGSIDVISFAVDFVF